MKKLITILLIFIISLQSIFAYNQTEKDKILLGGIYLKLDKISIKSYPKLNIQLLKLRDEYKNNDRVNYLVFELSNYINSKLITDKQYKVLEVSDGDTIKIDYNGEKTTIRLIGVDAPESFTTRYGYKECYGDEASNYLKNLLNGKNVGIETDKTQGEKDKYSRLLAYIKLDGENINAMLIRDGYAFEYTYDTAYKYSSEFKDYQNQAKDNKKGLWAQNTCNGERKKALEKNTSSTNTTNIIESNGLNNNNSYNLNYLNMGFNCEKTMYCKYMTSCEEATYYYKVCGAKTFDRDNDGIPCESLCGGEK